MKIKNITERIISFAGFSFVPGAIVDAEKSIVDGLNHNYFEFLPDEKEIEKPSKDKKNKNDAD